VRELSMPLFLALHAVQQPVVCSVRGYAVGAGMQFALLSDLVVAAHSARFVLPQIRLGHSVDHGESWALPRRVGVGRAMQLMALGETVSGPDAERFGLANWGVPDEQLEEKTADIVRPSVSARPAPTSPRPLVPSWQSASRPSAGADAGVSTAGLYLLWSSYGKAVRRVAQPIALLR
jgi:2-(1,2-epoxy-1,2-dihydrophenyl)acetyl-CoA isomerase